MNRIDLNGKKAVITGGARGIGYAIVERLLASGASCSLWDRDAVRLDQAEKSLSAAGRVHTAVVDIIKPEATQAAAEGTFKHFGGIDILVNCVTPAVIQTEILDSVPQSHVDYMRSRIPMDRFGRKEEAAAMVAWLCSEECSFSTGAVFDLSGGRATY